MEPQDSNLDNELSRLVDGQHSPDQQDDEQLEMNRLLIEQRLGEQFELGLESAEVPLGDADERQRVINRMVNRMSHAATDHQNGTLDRDALAETVGEIFASEALSYDERDAMLTTLADMSTSQGVDDAVIQFSDHGSLDMISDNLEDEQRMHRSATVLTLGLASILPALGIMKEHDDFEPFVLALAQAGAIMRTHPDVPSFVLTPLTLELERYFQTLGVSEDQKAVLLQIAGITMPQPESE